MSNVDAEFRVKNARDMREMARRLQSLQEEVNRRIDEVGEEIGLRIVADSRRGVNVDTGRLRASIDFDVENEDEYAVIIKVGSNVEYAVYQEIDSPYLRPAIEQNRDTITSLLEEAVVEAAEEA